MTKIYDEVRKLHKELWSKKEFLWPSQQLTPLQLLSPKVVAQILGLKFEELPNLGNLVFPYKGSRFKVAGLLDRQAKKIAISTEYPEYTQRFTAMHEIGHWLLHPNEVMHRDRPIDGSNSIKLNRPIFEKEADYFAACFLIPENLLKDKFKTLFQTELPFVLNETTAFHLAPNEPNLLLSAERTSLDREFAFARCTSFNGKHFLSLAKMFKVSDSAMAIRIKELQLIRWP